MTMHHKIPFLFIVLLLLSGAPALAQTAPVVPTPATTKPSDAAPATPAVPEAIPVTASTALAPVAVRGDDGLEAWLVSDSSLAIVSLYLVFDAGSVFDPDGKQGLAAMSAAALLEGTATLKRAAFFRSLEDLGIRLDTGSTRDILWVSLQTPTENLDEAIDMLVKMLTQAEASPEIINRIRPKILAELAFQQQKIDNRAETLWWESVFDNHPYRHNPLGKSETLASITSGDVKRFILQHLSRATLRIGIAGDVTADQTRAMLIKLEKALLKNPPEITVQPIVINKAIRPALAEAPGSQSAIYFGHRGINRQGKYYYHALVINHVLGGGAFSSRLMNALREEQGLTYGVYTSLLTGKYSPLLVGEVTVPNDQVKEALIALRAIWQTLATNGITEAELADAKSYLIGSFLLNNDSTLHIAQNLAIMQWQGLPITEWTERNNRIAGLTLAEVNSVATALISPANLSVAIVGSPPTLGR